MQRLGSFDAAQGGWKAYVIDVAAHDDDTINERFGNLYLTGDAEGANASVDWHYVHVGATGDGHDDDTPDSSFGGSWHDGTFEGVGSDALTLATFWYEDGREFACGTLMWPDGATAGVALVRP